MLKAYTAVEKANIDSANYKKERLMVLGLYYCDHCGSFIESARDDLINLIEENIEAGNKEFVVEEQMVVSEAMYKKCEYRSKYSFSDLEDIAYKYSSSKRISEKKEDGRLVVDVKYTLTLLDDFIRSREDPKHLELAQITNRKEQDPSYINYFQSIMKPDEETGKVNILYAWKNTAKCPICGKRMSYVPPVLYNWDGLDLKKMESAIKINDHNMAVKKVDKMFEEKMAFSSAVPANNTLERQQLVEYLQHVFELYSDIFFLKEQLVNFDTEIIEAKRMEIREKSQFTEKCKKEMVYLEKELVQAESRNVAMSLQIRPEDLGLHMPQEPEYSKPGFFNKKKVNAENERLRNKYEKAVQEFNEKWEKEKTREVRQREEYNAKALEKQKQLIKDLNAQKKCLTDKLEAGAGKLAISAVREFYENEIEEINAKVSEACDVLKKLLKSGILHPKYWDFVAVSSIYEYLSTGRCSTLEGGDGAYNLYEAEILANRVIDQLDAVIDSLNTIKRNQYLMYNVLTSINRNIKDISQKMSVAVDALSHLESDVSSIKETTEMIEYNTAKSAYYSKVNADLTNALGYMVAM